MKQHQDRETLLLELAWCIKEGCSGPRTKDALEGALAILSQHQSEAQGEDWSARAMEAELRLAEMTRAQGQVVVGTAEVSPIIAKHFENDPANAARAHAAISEIFSRIASAQQSDPSAWVHEDDHTRVISASQKAGALRDGGASASSVRPYSLAAFVRHAASASPAALTDERLMEIAEEHGWVIKQAGRAEWLVCNTNTPGNFLALCRALLAAQLSEARDAGPDGLPSWEDMRSDLAVLLSGATGKASTSWLHALDQVFDSGPLAKVHAMLSAPSTDSAAARDVLAERRRQVEVEGWTPEHDDEHGSGELAEAAICYAQGYRVWHPSGLHQRWPWALEWWKPKDRRSNLVKACALAIAEIERIDRAALAARREVGV